MKTLRYVLVGLMIGGGAGAKIGGYIANLSEAQISYNYVVAGFIYGSALGSFAALVFLAAFAIAGIQKNTSSRHSSGSLISST